MSCDPHKPKKACLESGASGIPSQAGISGAENTPAMFFGGYEYKKRGSYYVPVLRTTLYARARGKIVPKEFLLKEGDSLEKITGNPAYAQFFVDEVHPSHISFSLNTIRSEPFSWLRMVINVEYPSPTFQELDRFRTDVTRQQIEEFISTRGTRTPIPTDIIIKHPDLADAYLANCKAAEENGVEIVEHLLEHGYTPALEALIRYPDLAELERKFPGAWQRAVERKNRAMSINRQKANAPGDPIAPVLNIKGVKKKRQKQAMGGIPLYTPVITLSAQVTKNGRLVFRTINLKKGDDLGEATQNPIFEGISFSYYDEGSDTIWWTVRLPWNTGQPLYRFTQKTDEPLTLEWLQAEKQEAERTLLEYCLGKGWDVPADAMRRHSDLLLQRPEMVDKCFPDRHTDPQAMHDWAALRLRAGMPVDQDIIVRYPDLLAEFGI